jgi:hypothetical protein
MGSTLQNTHYYLDSQRKAAIIKKDIPIAIRNQLCELVKDVWVFANQYYDDGGYEETWGVGPPPTKDNSLRVVPNCVGEE